MAVTEGEKIVLGSGTLYCMEFTGTLPGNTEIETDENLLGLISQGASIEYKPEFYTIQDALGLVSKTVITSEEVLLKSGIMTWCGETLKKLCSTARVTEANGIRTVKIGGLKNYDGKKYVIHFWHHDVEFMKDKETVIDASFKAAPQDNEGTLVKYTEDIPVVPAG